MSLWATRTVSAALRLISTGRRDDVALALAGAAKGAKIAQNIRLARHYVVCPAQQDALNRVRSVVASPPISVAGASGRVLSSVI
jgi:hypothetical protein